MTRWGSAAVLLAMALTGLAAAKPAKAPDGPPPAAALIEIEGAIGPATSAHFEKAHRKALETGAGAIVLRMDTPGGLDTAMRDIIKVILNSPVPVIGFVAPGGARAASAGTYILYACHVAAMAPATNLGAATPVPVGGSAPFPGMPDEKPDKKGKRGEEPKPEPKVPEAGDAMSHKVVNDAVAYIRSLAEKRGRNADWAERAVRGGESLSASRALEEKVIDLVADDVAALLAKVDGRKVTTATGEVALRTAGATVQRLDPDWRSRLLGVITSPNIAYILLLIGIYGLLLEGYHPGAILPGVVGAICLLLAMFAFQMLPVNYVGLALIALGVVLMVAEALAPSFGVLGIGGIVAFVFGSIMLMDIDVPGYDINRGLVLGVALGAALIIALTLYLLWRSRRAPVVTGAAGMAGQVGELLAPCDGEGWALVRGERWRVRSSRPLAEGQQVRVTRMDGLLLHVEPLEKHS